MAECSLLSLPDSLVEGLFSLLAPADRLTLATCSQRTRSMLDSPLAWRNVTLTLKTYLSASGVTDSPLLIVGGLRGRDTALLDKYGDYLRDVRVVLVAGFLKRATIWKLLYLSWRGVVKSVHLDLHQFYASVSWESMDRYAGFSLLLEPMPLACRPHAAAVASFLEELKPGTDITVTLPPLSDTCRLDRRVCCKFYCSPVLKSVGSLVKKLAWPENFEDEHTHRVTDVISKLPSLQEIDMEVRHLSDAVLEELAGARKPRAPLSRMVLRVTEKDGTPHPNLSAQAWHRLAESSPSLKVKVEVTTRVLPRLDSIIKPETPLVELDVKATDSERSSLLRMYCLCRNHRGTLRCLSLILREENRGLHFSYTVKRALKKTVAACTKLQHLTLSVGLHCKTLQQLVTSGRQWRTFHCNLGAIACCEDVWLCRDVECAALECVCWEGLQDGGMEEALGFPAAPVWLPSRPTVRMPLLCDFPHWQD